MGKQDKNYGVYMCKKIIISFTSYPGRIAGIKNTLDSLVNQITKADKIILYLSEDEFPGKKIGADFSDYYKRGFEVRWCKGNLMSHKKYYYAFQEYPDDLVVTVDDDVIYAPSMIDELLKYHRKFPNAVIARRAHLMTFNETEIANYNDWYFECPRYVGIPRMDLFATGCGGILYPSGIFQKNFFEMNYFMKLCPYADDIWLKFWEVVSETPVVLCVKSFNDELQKRYSDDGLFVRYNKCGNDAQMKKVIKFLTESILESDKVKVRISENNPISAKSLSSEIKKDYFKELEILRNKIIGMDVIAIYGAGVVASRLISFIESFGLKTRIHQIIDRNACEINVFRGIHVCSANDFSDWDSNIIIALADKEVRNKVIADMVEHYNVSENRFVFLSDNVLRALRAYS